MPKSKVIWTFSGRIQVEENLTGEREPAVVEVKWSDPDPGDPDRVQTGTIPEYQRYHTRDLVGVGVEIAAAQKSGTFNKWKTTHTDANGRFRVEFSQKNKDRRFRVRVFLRDDRLKISHITRTTLIQVKPILVEKDINLRSGRTINFGTLTISTKPPLGQAARNDARRASIWYVLRSLQDHLQAIDPWLDFNKERLRVIYPANLQTWAREATVHVTRYYYNLSTILHESMHIWNYQHNTGTTNWMASWIYKGGAFNTHNKKESRSVAFHEGFAGWASDILQQMVFRGRNPSFLPYNKHHLFQEYEIEDMDDLQRSDAGVKSALHFLTFHNPNRLRFGTRDEAPPGVASLCRYLSDAEYNEWVAQPKTANLDYSDVLLAFRGVDGSAYPEHWFVGDPKLGVVSFYDRIAALNPDKFPEDVKEKYLSVLDPESTEEFEPYRRPL